MGDRTSDRKSAKPRQIDPQVEALIATLPNEGSTRRVLEAVDRAEASWQIGEVVPRSEPTITVSTTGSVIGE